MTDPVTVADMLARMDEGWGTFHDQVTALPSERLELHIGEGGWTRKQMLAHLGTWHDLTVERLGGLMSTGEPQGLDEHEDAINARAARAATGRTTGEIVQGVEDSFRRLRRQVSLLTEEQLAAHDSWAAAIVRGNSFGHYEEHLADLG